jgi:hypothetical protein
MWVRRLRVEVLWAPALVAAGGDAPRREGDGQMQVATGSNTDDDRHAEEN